MFWGYTVFKGLPDSLWHRENTITLPGTAHYACCSLSSHLMCYLRGWLDGLNSVRSHLPYHCLLPVHLSRQMVSKYYWVLVFPLYCALSVVWFTWYFICPPPPPTPTVPAAPAPQGRKPHSWVKDVFKVPFKCSFCESLWTTWWCVCPPHGVCMMVHCAALSCECGRSGRSQWLHCLCLLSCVRMQCQR